MTRYHLIALSLCAVLGAAPAGAQQSRADTAALRFVQGMMHHHAQAIVMGRLVPTHTARADIDTAAKRIVVSQSDEIALMRRWLERRHAEVPAIDTNPPDTLAHSMDGMDMGGMRMTMQSPLMPGMLTHEQLVRLARARGPAFDSLFLMSMIAHHEGALKMVSDLFAVPGATDDPELFQLASDIDADQRAEIARMRSMQARHLPKAPSHR